ncbi:hypothetical protein A2982_02190 [candidate division WWE3 bacterium RIFCSPLOWO2_01_FULL_39_13]|uniref:Solute-binding protein family 5 domain-containing protein n=1 Tax=candidate division WWE3 bacterium RIFCSPLOWO2_01_FULL_39_13 TaxID=1802624 RepID=A0A1F4V426_UNCKA|nr:MAG: hypothetical protein A2982_02190 [candidate division WWE3 bacterium RIFCSPLOWO2_01_FULL_39_13]
MILYFIRLLIVNLLITLSTVIPQRTYSIGYIGQPASFLPHEAQTDSEKAVSDVVFRKLFKYEEGKLVNDLVDKYEISEDETEYRIALKDNIKWQDGQPITSDDILYSLTLYENFRNEIDVEKTSEKEVTLKLPTPTGILPSLLTIGLEPAHIPRNNRLKPIGSSSYRIARIIRERNYVQGVILQSLQKNKQYSRIAYRFYTSDNELKTAYKLGEIAAFLSNSEFIWPSVQMKKTTYLGRYFVVIFNTPNQPLDDPEIRAVLGKSLDIRGFLKENNYYSNSLPAEGPISYYPVEENGIPAYTIFPFLTDSYDKDTKLNTLQKGLLTKLDILLPNNQDGRQIAVLLEEGWEKQLGITLNIQYLELNELLDKAREGTFDALFIGHEVSPDPDRYLFWHSTQIGDLNLGRFKDLRADTALEEGRLTVETEERIKHYNIFQDVIYTKTPAVFIYHPGQYFYFSSDYPITLPEKIYYPSEITKNL